MVLDVPDHLEQNNPKPLDDDDIALLKTYVSDILSTSPSNPENKQEY
jgi:hypothetical protein